MRTRVREQVFNFERWAYHRKSTRYLRHFRTLGSSIVIRSVSFPVSVVFLFTILICFANGWLLPLLSLPIIGIPLIPLQMTSFLISLLLVFRTTQSYNRYREARQVLGRFGNSMKNLVRQSELWISPASPKHHREVLMRCITAVRTLNADVCGWEEDSLRESISSFGSARDVCTVSRCKVGHRTLKALQFVGQTIVKTPNISERQGIVLDRHVQSLVEAVGGCQRIISTPIPVSYTRHTSRFLLAWLLLLPCGLYPVLKQSTLLFTPLISFCLFCIDEIGVEIEEPFSVLPVNAICNSIESQLKLVGLLP